MKRGCLAQKVERDEILRQCEVPLHRMLLEEAGYFYSYTGLMSRVVAKLVMLLSN